MSTLAERINDALPQTQCTRCGFPDCKAYAQAIALDNAPIINALLGALRALPFCLKSLDVQHCLSTQTTASKAP